MIRRLWQVNGIPREVRCPPLKPLLQVLREELEVTGVKEGCGEGECGACLALLDGRPVTSCLVAAGQAPDGARIWTAEGLAAQPLGAVIATAFVEHGAVQCGICFPGMLVAAFAFLRDTPAPTEADTRAALSGNLCRCTGYTKIVDAILAAAGKMPYPERARALDDDAPAKPGGPGGRPPVPEVPAATPAAERDSQAGPSGAEFLTPATLAEALALRARFPGATLLAGGTDLMVVWQAESRAPILAAGGTHAAKGGGSETGTEDEAREAAAARSFAPGGETGAKDGARDARPLPILSLAAVSELRGIACDQEWIAIGAATPVEEIVRDSRMASLAPALLQAAGELGARPIRHLATIGGNLANASPAADLAPPLLAADARLRIASAAGSREIRLADFYRDYKQLDLRPDEIIVSVRLPALRPTQREGFRKLGTRRAQSIAKVGAAVRLTMQAGRIAEVAIAAGSVAPTPMRLPHTEARLSGARVDAATLAHVKSWVAEEVRPIDDIRSTSAYRRAMTGVLVADLLAELGAAKA